MGLAVDEVVLVGVVLVEVVEAVLAVADLQGVGNA